MSTWLEEGQAAPDFELQADDGSTVRLKSLRGEPVVVYFYPRDDTPGCTREACAFRDRKAEPANLGLKVLGISTDDVKSHGKFRDKYSLNFPLLADTDHRTAEAFGAWQEKNMYGKKSWGIVRSTFLIDAGGKVRRAWRRVNVDGHDAEVIAAVGELGGAGGATAVKKAKVAKPQAKAIAKKAPAKGKPVKKTAVATKAPAKKKR
jgi:thioredoxin-dependent peroxiredoxin